LKAVILLATYNGERHLAEQLESLAAQTHRDWQLWVRDDGSTDRSPQIARDFAARGFDVRLLPSDGRRLGPAASFGYLLGRALAEPTSNERIFFFCDQDDIWKANKIARTLECFADVSHRGRAVFSDLEVVNQDCRPIASSFQTMARLRYRAENPLTSLIVQNHVTGCTLAFDAELARRSLPFPADLMMHDWWIALLAAASGELVEIEETTLLYRQHEAQASGGVRAGRLARFWGLLKRWTPLVALMEGRFRQSRALETRLRERDLAPKAQAFLATYHRRAVRPFPFSALGIWVLGIRLQTLPRTLVYALLLGLTRERIRSVLALPSTRPDRA